MPDYNRYGRLPVVSYYCPAGCVKIFTMEQPEDQPIYWDSSRSSINFTLVFALGVAVFGLITLPGGLLLTIAGLAVATLNWLTNPRQYLVYRDALVIVYGRPRVGVIPFTEIDHLDVVSLIGDRLRVVTVRGRRMLLQMRDIQTFHDQLQEALTKFRETQPQVELSEEATGDQDSL